jgi:hypothetical protein
VYNNDDLEEEALFYDNPHNTPRLSQILKNMGDKINNSNQGYNNQDGGGGENRELDEALQLAAAQSEALSDGHHSAFDHDLLFWFGDLNYRIDIPSLSIEEVFDVLRVVAGRERDG